ncbi:HEAT repeat domain-containing protein [Herbidospora sp. RD11066]
MSLDLSVQERLEFLRNVISSPDFPDHVRAAATLTIPLIDPRSAPDLLAEILQMADRPELVTAKAVTLLGQLGDEHHIDVLRNVEEFPASESVRELARSAVNLAKSRHHLPGLRFPPYERVHPGAEPVVEISGEEVGFPLKDLTVEGIRKIFPDVTRDDFSVYKLRCGDKVMALAIRRELAVNPGLLLETTHLAGVVSVVHNETETLEPIHLAMTDPADGRLWVTRLSGELLCVGEGGHDGSGFLFKLMSVAGPGVPLLWADVHIAEGRLLIKGQSALRIQRGRTLEPLPDDEED